MKLNTVLATTASLAALAALASGAPILAGGAATVGILGAAITAMSNNTESPLTNGTSANGTSTNSTVTGTPLLFGDEANTEKVDKFVTAMIAAYGKQDLGSELQLKNGEHARNRRSLESTPLAPDLSSFNKAKEGCDKNKGPKCAHKMLFGAEGGWGDDDVDDDNDGSQEAETYLTQYGPEISNGIAKKMSQLGDLKRKIEKYIPTTTEAPITTTEALTTTTEKLATELPTTTTEAPTTTEEALTTRPKPKSHQDDHWYDGWFNSKTGKQEDRWRDLKECAQVRAPSNGKPGDCEMRNNCRVKVRFSYAGNEKPVDLGEAVDCFKGPMIQGKDGDADRQSWRAIGEGKDQVKVTRDD